MKALLVIDAQKDYLANGCYPLWNIDDVLINIKNNIQKAIYNNEKIIFIQHIGAQTSPFFKENSEGVELIEDLYKDVPEEQKIVIQKKHGDAFIDTNLLESLIKNSVKSVDVCGMMTQNCVLFTSITAKEKGFNPTVLSNSCTSVSAIIHGVAMNGMKNLFNII